VKELSFVSLKNVHVHRCQFNIIKNMQWFIIW